MTEYIFPKHALYVVLLLVLAIVIPVAYYHGRIDTTLTFTFTFFSIALFIGIVYSHHARKKLFKEVFDNYNDRFRQMNTALNSIDSVGGLSHQDRKLVIDYLALCAEAYVWRKRAIIPGDVWTAWMSRVEIYLQKPSIKQVFDEIKASSPQGYYQFFDLFV